VTRTELFRTQPWQVIVQWWFVTAVCLCYITPLMLLLIANPLWFRQTGLKWIVRHTEWIGGLRDRMLKSQFDKYRLFEILKDAK